ncbi:MAG: PDZ domain-containing protein, partial [Clostridia bacterium]|nr:PDZ domain-containing protein [Clostridia bacterium]
GSMTDGIVSALNRKIEINGSFMTLIQTNASINPGNSGGPLVNAYGQVVGICSSKLVATDYEGIGFAIPINDVVNLSEELINYGYIRTRAYIGIMGSDLQEDYCEYHDIPRGVYVSYVDPECDAAKKGMKEGDIIIGFNGKELTSMAQLNELKNEFRPGDTEKVKVWRNEKELEFEIKLTESEN